LNDDRPHSDLPDKKRGKDLAKHWGLNVQQPLYRETGDWYHQLKKFPGALLDADGYVIFESAEALKECPRLRIGKDPQRHGGWVSAPNGIKAIPGYVYATDRGQVESVLRLRSPAQGQGWGGSAEGRRVIESYAMEVAKRHYCGLWREVVDVSSTESFDLLCRNGERELRVEVKGTTSLGLSVFLTRNEVRHAQANNGRVALFIVFNIVAAPSGCSGGQTSIIEPWDIGQDQLEPVAFECRLRPRQPATAPRK
jgi:hypothetical protein